MSATYTGQPTTSPIDRIRLLIGDTDMASPLLSDEEILFFIDLEPNPFLAAGSAARAIAAKFSGDDSEIKFDDISVKSADVQESFLSLAKSLEVKGSRSAKFPRLGSSAGGISKSAAEVVRQNPDREQTDWKGRFKNPPTPGVRP